MQIEINFGPYGSVSLPVTERHRGRNVEFISDISGLDIHLQITDKAHDEIVARWSALLDTLPEFKVDLRRRLTRREQKTVMHCIAGSILHAKTRAAVANETRAMLCEVLMRPASYEAFTDEAFPRRIPAVKGEGVAA